MVYVGLWKRLSKEESLEPGLKLRQSGEISQTGRQRIPDRLSDEIERALTREFPNYFWNFQKLLVKNEAEK